VITFRSLLQSKSGTSRLARGALVALIIILSISALSFVVGNNQSVFSHSYIAAASSTSDPIATGNWQQDQYDSIIISESQAHGLDPFIVKGQIALESQFNTWAVSQVINSACDWTHDEGLMQVNAYCQQTGSANLFDPATNIYYGTQQLASAYWQTGSIDLALQAYNIGLPNVLAGGRNWAYSSAVESYAQQFENEHCAVYGCWTSTTTTTTSTTWSSSSSAYSASTTSSSTTTTTSKSSDTQSSHTSSTSKTTSKSTDTIISSQSDGDYYNEFRAHDPRVLELFWQVVGSSLTRSSSSSNISTQEVTNSASQISHNIALQNVQVNQNGRRPILPSSVGQRATFVLYSILFAFFLASLLVQQKKIAVKQVGMNIETLRKVLSKMNPATRLRQKYAKIFSEQSVRFRKWASESL
jgi:hypothetical protein